MSDTLSAEQLAKLRKSIKKDAAKILAKQNAMPLKVKKRLDDQLDRMTKAMRKGDAGGCGSHGKSSSINNFDEHVNAEHYLVACRESFIHYYKAKETDGLWILNRRHWNKYDYACNYLSERMEFARLWFDRALCDFYKK